MSGDRTSPTSVGPTAGPPLLPEERRWLHDKYERLSAEEGALSASRTSYFAALGTVLITGLVVALADLMANHEIFAVVVTFLGALGIMISVVWAILLHRTNDAQHLWREAARQLEKESPPILSTLPTPVQLRSGEMLELDLARPYLAHAQRFSRSARISWMDRVDPSATTEILPWTFLVIWSTVLIVAWSWFVGIL
jgi:hypothetical protein